MDARALAGDPGLRDQVEPLCREAGVELLYLFGSQARGEALPMSDVDFAVLFAREVPASDHAKRQELLIVELMGILRRDDVDVVLLDRASALMRHRAATEGLVVFEARPSLHAEFLVRALREYDDTRSLREALAESLRARYDRR